MPNKARKRGKKWRVMHDTPKGPRLTKNKAGTAIDGGGHSSKKAAQKQATASNIK